MISLLWTLIYQLLIKSHMHLPHDSAIPRLDIYPKEIKIQNLEHSMKRFHSSFIHNCQKLEITQIFINIWTFPNIQQGNSKRWKEINCGYTEQDKWQNLYTGWKQPNQKQFILSDSIYLKPYTRQNYCQMAERRPIVAQGNILGDVNILSVDGVVIIGENISYQNLPNYALEAFIINKLYHHKVYLKS